MFNRFGTITKKNGIKYQIASDKPFSGFVYEENLSDRIKLKGYYNNGQKEDLWTEWYENGFKWKESILVRLSF